MISSPVAPYTILTLSVVFTSDYHRFCAVLHSAVALSATTHSSPLVHDSTILSASLPRSAAMTVSLAALVHCPPLVTVTSPVPLVLLLLSATSALFHDMNDEEYKTALDMMHVERLLSI